MAIGKNYIQPANTQPPSGSNYVMDLYTVAMTHFQACFGSHRAHIGLVTSQDMVAFLDYLAKQGLPHATNPELFWELGKHLLSAGFDPAWLSSWFPGWTYMGWFNGFPQWKTTIPAQPVQVTNLPLSKVDPADLQGQATMDAEGPITLSEEQIKAMYRLKCDHDMKDYFGLVEAFKYCTKCDHKEPL